MVEVLRRGIKPSEKVVEATCKTCQSLLRFKVGEAKRVADQRDGDFLVVSCPVCADEVTAAASSAKAPSPPFSGNWRD